MPDTQLRPLRAFAESLRQEQVSLTERWMRAVFHDIELSDADRLTYEQLSDHIPAILEEICSALEDQDLDQVEPAIERNARKHGKLRWKQGYRIDELVRELDLFRQMLAGQIVEVVLVINLLFRSGSIPIADLARASFRLQQMRKMSS